MSCLFHLDDIHFGYHPGQPVLRGASFALAAGERLRVDGPNGAGKSTLLLLMLGLLTPARGTVTAFGRACRTEADFRPVRARAGLVFQDPDDQLFCPTVLDDVAFGPLNLGKPVVAARAAASDALAQVGLDGFEDRLTPHLSGGEKRLVTLASVLAMKPEALLLDEPTNALDDQARERVEEVLAGLPLAMVIVSHDHAFADRLATRQLNLSAGRLVVAD